MTSDHSMIEPLLTADRVVCGGTSLLLALLLSPSPGER